jgi:ATP-dependent helicase HrpA
MSKYSQTYQRDRVLEDEVNQIYDKWYNYVDELELRNKIIARELYDFRYKIEELRVSFFAQELKTLYPVSSKRLLNKLEQLYLQNLT